MDVAMTLTRWMMIVVVVVGCPKIGKKRDPTPFSTFWGAAANGRHSAANARVGGGTDKRILWNDVSNSRVEAGKLSSLGGKPRPSGLLSPSFRELDRLEMDRFSKVIECAKEPRTKLSCQCSLILPSRSRAPQKQD